MADEPENLVLRQLREMRGEIKDGLADTNGRIDGLQGRLGRFEAGQAELKADVTAILKVTDTLPPFIASVNSTLATVSLRLNK